MVILYSLIGLAEQTWEELFGTLIQIIIVMININYILGIVPVKKISSILPHINMPIQEHTFSNCVLSCIICNVKKKDKEVEVARCDIENFLDVVEAVLAFRGERNIRNTTCDYVGAVAHIPYCASITLRDEEVLKAKYYKNLRNIEFDGEDTWTQLEDWFLNKSKEIEDEVNYLESRWFEHYKKKHKNLSEKEGKQVKNNNRSQLIENHRLIMYSFNGSIYENQIIHKSKRLKFESETETFGFIEITLKENLLSFVIQCE